jgi:pimeloyl-ACP methyl ester carboxylesterase
VLLRALRNDPIQEYLVYVPESAAPGAPVLVSVHGVSRNAHEQARVFSELCDEHGAILLVPIFTADQHRDYQRLGRAGRGNRVDLLLNRYLAEVGSLSGADVTQVRLFGFSAGAQFAHRYLMAHPHRVARAVVVAAGWYTFPDPRRRYPYGIRPVRSLEGVNFNPEAFLRVPVEVLVGERDIGSSNLRSTERLDAQQGKNRVERAHCWVSAMQAAAAAHGLHPEVSLTEVPDIDHSFKAFCNRGALLEHVGRALFEAPRVASEIDPPVDESEVDRVLATLSVAEGSR